MNPGIFLIQKSGELLEMNEEEYNSEDLLQSLLAKYPALLAGNQIDPDTPRKWLLIERECTVPSRDVGGGRFSADHLFLDQEAIPTFVEVKRSSNTQIRREVVGQMLDYAANAVVYWPIDRIREQFFKSHGSAADETLKKHLEGEEIGPDEFWQQANKNLQDHRIRLLFVADEIPSELQRIVEFLNEQMDRTEVLAVEIKQFVGGEQTGLVPKVIGRTAEAQIKKPPREKCTWEQILAALNPEEAELAKKIREWSDSEEPKIEKRSFIPEFRSGSIIFTPIGVNLKGKMVIRFKNMTSNPPFDNPDMRREFQRRLIAIPVELFDKNTDKYPGFALSDLLNKDALEKFREIVKWAIAQVNKA
jgi:hypothetical protein